MVTSQAFALEPTEASRKRVDIDGTFACQLPKVRCPACRRRLNDPYVEYPVLDAAGLELGGGRDLSPDEFSPIRDRVRRVLGEDVPVVPGALAGPFEGSVRGELEDFAWILSWTPLASQAALRSLAEFGVALRYGRASLKGREGVVTTHSVLQCALAQVFDNRTMVKLGIERCPTCGDFWKGTLSAYPGDGYGLRKSAWPPGAHLVKPLERASIILVSDAFAAAFGRHQFRGACLRCIGEWV